MCLVNVALNQKNWFRKVTISNNLRKCVLIGTIQILELNTNVK